MGFKLVRVDSAEPYKVILRLGSHLIGRGKLLDCNDNRVSRNHAELIVTSDSILLKSLHQNPCFVKKKASEDTVIFSQPDSQVLTNGDQFGLIPEHYWYEVIQMSADTSSPSTDSQEMNAQAVNGGLNQDVTRNDSNTQSYVPEPPDDDQNCSQSVLDEVFDAPFDLPQENQASSSTQMQNVLNKSDRIEHMDISSSERQTESNELARTPDQTDRLQSENEPSTPNQSIATNVEMDQHESNNNHGHTASNKMSYEDEDIDPVHQTAMLEDTEHTANKSPSKRLHSEDESPLNAKRIKTEPETPSKDDKNNVLNEASCSNQGIKQEPDSPQDAKPGPSNVQGPSNAGPNNAPNMPPSPTKPVNNLPRERCWYGANCYRKNPAHKAQFSHPADPDWGGGAQGVCPWGAGCARRDPRHWRDHSHPPRPAPATPPRRRLGMRVDRLFGRYFVPKAIYPIEFYEEFFADDDSDDSVDLDYEF